MNIGDVLGPLQYSITRDDLVAYAKASGDHNPIHQDEAAAQAIGLPTVVAHGMLTMALAARALHQWTGGPGNVGELGVKFTKPVPVWADRPAELEISGEVTAREGDHATIRLTVTCEGEKVLGVSRAQVTGLPTP